MISVKKLLTKILTMIGGSSMGTTATTLTGAIAEVKTETRPVSKGGTGATSFTSNAVLYGNGSIAIGAKSSANGALYATAANGALSWGTLPIAQGGTGATATTTTSTASNVVSAASGFSITSANYAQWGKVAMVHIVFKKNSTAVSTATTTTLGTVVSGKRPAVNASANYGWASNVMISTNGAVTYYGTIAANASMGVYAVYILA